MAEEQCLQQIYVDELFGSQAEQNRQKEKEDEKKKLVPFTKMYFCEFTASRIRSTVLYSSPQQVVSEESGHWLLV